MNFEQCVDAVYEELRTNRQGAYSLAVRLGATHRQDATKLMETAVAREGRRKPAAKPPKPKPAPTSQPSVEEVEAKLQKEVQAQLGNEPLAPDTYALIHVLAQILVEQRDYFLALMEE